jgi:diguanylate cyclase (GGDEF)-like protein
MNFKLSRECNSQRKAVGPPSVILLDVAYFKVFNDTYGHQESDVCLKSFGKAITTSVNRQTDMVARYGGEEFCCILPFTDYDEAMLTARRIRTNVEALQIVNQGSGTAEHVAVSLGVVTITPNTASTPEQVLKIADNNLYAAKGDGRKKLWVGTVPLKWP